MVVVEGSKDGERRQNGMTRPEIPSPSEPISSPFATEIGSAVPNVCISPVLNYNMVLKPPDLDVQHLG